MGKEVATITKAIVGKGREPVTRLVTEDTRRGWIEYNKSGTKRYPRRRWWLRHNGKWVKNKKPPRIKNYGPFTEAQYKSIKELDRRIKEAEYRE